MKATVNTGPRSGGLDLAMPLRCDTCLVIRFEVADRLLFWIEFCFSCVHISKGRKMWDSTPEFLELFKNFPVSISILFVVPIVLLSGPVSPVTAAHEFPVFRMQQFDLHQNPSGKCGTAIIPNKY